MQPIRTISLIPVKIKISMDETMPLYQKLAPKIRELKALGMTNIEISKKLGINRRTVSNGLIFSQKKPKIAFNSIKC